MRIQAHILPRRVILALLFVLGLGLRLWGLDWGPERAGSLHPAEWTWRIIEGLSFSNPTHPGIWTQAFFSLAALVKGFFSIIMGWWEVLVGQARAMAEVGMTARLAGRLTVALLGASQALLVYQVGRRFFNSVATGLLAAAVVAVNPLLVAQGHYLSLDVPLGTAVLGCLWVAWVMAERPGAAITAAAGLLLGLATTTRASGVLMLLVLAAAYAIGVRRERPGMPRAAGLWPLCFVLGLAAGLVLGYPGFVLTSDTTGELIKSSLSLPSATLGQWWGFLGDRSGRCMGVLGDSVGLELLLLWAAGVAVIVRYRQFKRLLLATVPVLYFFAGVLVLRGPMEGIAAVWLPPMTMLAVWPLVLLCRRLPTYARQVAGVAVLGCLLCLWPLWQALGVGYLFWQEDTYSSARHWVEDNLDPAAPLIVEPSTPLGVFIPSRPYDASRQGRKMEHSYLAVSSLAPEALAPWRLWPSQSSAYRGLVLPDSLQLMKKFDLKSAWLGGGAGFPRWVSPRVELFAGLEDQQIMQPLSIYRPPVGEHRAHSLVYAEPMAYSRGQGVMIIPSLGLGQRVLFHQTPLRRVGVILGNMGDDLARIELSQGPWGARKLRLYPGQLAEVELATRPWPPMFNACYPVRVALSRGSAVLAKIMWDPLLLGRRALEAGRFKEAAEHLGKAAESGGVEARAMLAGALARLGKLQEASAILAGLGSLKWGVVADYYSLATAPSTGLGWQKRFTAFTGYHYRLLEHACSLQYFLGGPACRAGGVETPFKGKGFHGSYRQPDGERKGGLRVWFEAPLPVGQLRARFHFMGGPNKAKPSTEAAEVEIWGHSHQGSRRLAAGGLSAGDLAQGKKNLELVFRNSREGTRLEARAALPAGWKGGLEKITLSVDIQAHMRSILRWYCDACGRAALAEEKYEQAVEAFDALFKLDPDFSDSFIPAAKALSDAGKPDEAIKLIRRAEGSFRSRPEELARIKEIYDDLNRPADAARVEKRLGFLRPSLKREARFAGGLTLLGYDLSPSKVKPGGALNMSFYWRCWQPPPLNYFIFVHLRGKGKPVIYDHLLDHGRSYMPELKPGDVVREDYKVTIPKNLAPGAYRLVVGLWDPHFTGKGVAVLEGVGQGSEEVSVAEVQVMGGEKQAPAQGGPG